MAASDAPVRALGGMSSTLGQTYGYGLAMDESEHIPDLQWPASVAVFGRMRSDPVVSSILAAYTGPLLAADWRINPRGADPANVRVCADSLGIPVVGEQVSDIGAIRRRGAKWREHVRLAALHLVWGHFAFEPVYEIRDGKAYLSALPERMPNTITDIQVNDDGTLKGIVQAGQPGKNGNRWGGVEIPADRLLWYCHSREGSAFAGRSLIRPCYSDWLLKVDGKRANAVGLNRFSAGTPVAEPLPGTNPTPAQIAEAQRMVSAVRVGQTGGAVPVGFKLRIIGIEGTLPDALASLRFYNEEMRAAGLVSVLDLGSSANGSRALGETFADLLNGAIQGVANYMAEVATQLCERLTSFNYGADAVSPEVVCGDVGASKAAITASITGLVQAGIITPDATLEEFARDGYHLPPAAPAVAAPEDPEKTGGTCGQPKDNGEPCTRPAGWGTGHPGEGPCVDHDGSKQKAGDTKVAAAGGLDRNRGNAEALRREYLHGKIAARIRWGTPNDWTRCVAIASEHMTHDQAQGYCQLRHKEATGLYTGDRRHLSAAETPSPYREATPAEQAAGVDPAAIDETQDGIVAEGMAVFAAIVAVWGTALAGQIVAALGAGSLVALARMSVDTTDAAEALAVLMREAADAGVRQVRDEAAHAGTLLTGPVPVDGDALDDAAAATAELMGEGMARAAGREAARLTGPDVDPDDIAQLVVAAVTDSDTPIHDAISAGITRAMGAGRAAAQAAVLGTGVQLQPLHTAIRDTESCARCLAGDGTVYPDLATALQDFPSGGYRLCLGRARCRCLLTLTPRPL